jgi:hypothetical protein
MKYRGKQYGVLLSIGGNGNGPSKSTGIPSQELRRTVPLASSWPKPKLIGHWPRRRSAWCDRSADQHITFDPF